jgi:MinD superfamily P-loop ATPase
MVRNEARTLAEENGIPLVVIDGPPGIGCPVISSMTGTHVAVIVTEPTISGLHDLERIIGLTQFFHCKVGVIVNKSDVNREYCKRIEEYCTTKGGVFLGAIPYDHKITEAQIQATTILDIAPDSEASKIIRIVHKNIFKILEEL